MPHLKIGIRIRNLRMDQKRTIQEIAAVCGLSKSMISKIETNSVIPSVSTLYKIAKSLGVNMSVLMDENDWPGSVVITAEKATENTTKTDRGYYMFPFAAEYRNKKMQPFMIVAKKGEVKDHHVSHDGEEFIYVLEGEMKIRIGTTDYTLKQGDSVYFNALEIHGIKPISEKVKYLNIFV